MGNSVYTSVPAEQPSDPIGGLALDLRWAWNHATDEVWRELDPDLWESTQDPWLILQAVSLDRLQSLLSDSRCRQRVRELLNEKAGLEIGRCLVCHGKPRRP